MLIRVATPVDLPLVVDLAARTFPLACPPGMSTADMDAFVAEHLSAGRFAEHHADPAAEILVAEADDGALHGYTLTFAREPYGVHAQIVRARPSVELSKCYVDPRAQGTGTAAYLIGAVLDRARDGGAHSVWLGVNSQNARAQRFYAKAGFVAVGERTFTVGRQTERDLVLECDLEPITAV